MLFIISVAGASWKASELVVTAYCPCQKCCGKWADGITASGHKLKAGDKIVAAPKRFKFHTPIHVPGYGYASVEDRGGAIKGNKIDIWFKTHQEALNWGIKTLTVWYWEEEK